MRTISLWSLVCLLVAALLAGCAPDKVTSTAVPVATSSTPATSSTTVPGPTTAPVREQGFSAVPLCDMTADDRYKSEDGGLYGKGLNVPPPAHRETALKELALVTPLDRQGKPSAGGKVVLISIGMSNTTQEFSAFKQLADADPGKASDLYIVDGAQGGQTAKIWATQDAPWQVVLMRLQNAGVTPEQVQVVWVKQANAQPAGQFPVAARELQAQLGTIMRLVKEHFPNVRVAYLSSRIYAGYATTTLNPEPHAFESAFAVRWLIQQQIAGDTGLNYDPGAGPVKSPLMLWGPYLWADGLNPRSDGLTWERSELSPTDGTHPGETGRKKVARIILDFFKTNDLARSWFARSR